MNEYEKQAIDFAKKTGTELRILSSHYGSHFTDDVKRGEKRWVFHCRLVRKGKKFEFDFGQSLAAGKKHPTMYDVLSCFQKSDVGTFENFCDEFGYDTDSRSAEKVYHDVKREWENVERLFGDVLEELQEIN